MRYILTALILVFPLAASASENKLGVSLVFQGDSTDNYLMSETKEQELSGIYLKPKISYQRYSDVAMLSLTAEESIARYNLSEYNIESPSFSASYKRVMERSSVDIDYDRSIQSTLISEFRDSGNFFRESSRQATNTAKASWGYRLTERDEIAVNMSLQTINYDSESYADLDNKGIQASLQHELTETVSVYGVISFNQYESSIKGVFAVEPQLIQGHLIYPPNTPPNLYCGTFVCAIGDADNTTRSTGLQLGGKWHLHEKLIASFAAGTSEAEVSQHIELPTTSAEFGPPIDQNVLFGGERTINSDSRFTTASTNLTYQRETSSYSLAISRQIQPSSNGGLWKTETIEGTYHVATSSVGWLDFNLLYQEFLTVRKVVNPSTLDRNIFYGSIKYGHSFSDTLTCTASIGYKWQESTLSETLVAKAMLGTLSLSYTPREWAW